MGSYGIPADRSKFQLHTMARRITIIFTQTGLNPAAEIVLNMLFITLLTHTIRKKEEQEKKEQSRDFHDDIHSRSPTLPDRAQLEWCY